MAHTRYVTCPKCKNRYRQGTRHTCPKCSKCGAVLVSGVKHVCPVVTPPSPPPVEPTPAIHNLVFGSNQTYTNVTIGGPGEQVRHQPGAHDVLVERTTIIGGGTTDVMTLGDGCGSLTRVTFRGGGVACNTGTENASRSLGLNNIGISDDSAAHVENILFENFVFGLSNGKRTGCPRMHLEVTNRGHNLKSLHIIGCTFELCDETSLDIESDPAAPDMDILIQDCNLKGGVYPISPEPRWQQTICLELAPYARVLGNHIGNSRWGALELYDRSNSANSHILVEDNDVYGDIYLTGCHGATVRGNRLHEGARIVERDGASGNVIEDNTSV